MKAFAEILCFCIGLGCGAALVFIGFLISMFRQPSISATRDEEDNS